MATFFLFCFLCQTWAGADFFYQLPQPVPVLENFRPVSDEQVQAGRVQAFQFQGGRGHGVPGLLFLPPGKGPFPVVVFLYGIGQSQDFTGRIADPFLEAGFALATFEHYGRGLRKVEDPALWEYPLILRQRCALTVLDGSRLARALARRPEVAGERIYYFGASYGAIMGGAVMAREPLYRAGVLSYGGADIGRIFSGPEWVRRTKTLEVPLRWLLVSLLDPADPKHFVAGVAPRPLLFQNGRQDRIIRPVAARAYHEVAREPKTVLWYDSRHVGYDEGHTAQVLEDAVQWLKARDDEIVGQ